MPPKNVNYTAKQSAGYYSKSTGGRAGAAKRAASKHRSSALAKTRAAPYVSRRYARVVSDRLGENKYFDINFNAAIGTDATAATLVTDLCIIPQGLTVNSRVGKKLRVMRLAMKGNIYTTASPLSSVPQSVVRLSIVWDREPDKAALVPAITDVFMTNGSIALTNRDNAPRFKILKHLVFCLIPSVSAAGVVTNLSAQNQVAFDEFLDLSRKDLEIIWTKADTAGATAAKVKGNLLAVFTSDQSLTTGLVTAVVNYRVDYQDESSKK